MKVQGSKYCVPTGQKVYGDPKAFPPLQAFPLFHVRVNFISVVLNLRVSSYGLSSFSSSNLPIYTITTFHCCCSIWRFCNSWLSLSANEEASPWLSPSGDFAIGFYKLDNNLFLLSIWYAKIPKKTIFWCENGDSPVPAGSKVLLTYKGLQLNGRQGEQRWILDRLTGAVASGYMDDTGNFAIIDGNSHEYWGSFRFPTDTLLPSQMIERGQGLVSRKSEMNFSSGRFSLSLLDVGNLVLSALNLPSSYLNSPYYKSGTDDAVNSSNSGYQLVFNESGYLFVLRANGGEFMLSQGEIVSVGDFYHRVTLDFDGVLAQYYHPKNATGNETWSVL